MSGNSSTTNYADLNAVVPIAWQCLLPFFCNQGNTIDDRLKLLDRCGREPAKAAQTRRLEITTVEDEILEGVMHGVGDITKSDVLEVAVGWNREKSKLVHRTVKMFFTGVDTRDRGHDLIHMVQHLVENFDGDGVYLKHGPHAMKNTRHRFGGYGESNTQTCHCPGFGGRPQNYQVVEFLRLVERGF